MRKEKLKEEFVLSLFLHLCRGLVYLHEEIKIVRLLLIKKQNQLIFSSDQFHRNIRPSSCLLFSNGVLKLSDFRSDKIEEDGKQTL